MNSLGSITEDKPLGKDFVSPGGKKCVVLHPVDGAVGVACCVLRCISWVGDRNWGYIEIPFIIHNPEV